MNATNSKVLHDRARLLASQLEDLRARAQEINIAYVTLLSSAVPNVELAADLKNLMSNVAAEMDLIRAEVAELLVHPDF